MINSVCSCNHKVSSSSKSHSYGILNVSVMLIRLLSCSILVENDGRVPCHFSLAFEFGKPDYSIIIQYTVFQAILISFAGKSTRYTY